MKHSGWRTKDILRWAWTRAGGRFAPSGPIQDIASPQESLTEALRHALPTGYLPRIFSPAGASGPYLPKIRPITRIVTTAEPFGRSNKGRSPLVSCATDYGTT